MLRVAEHFEKTDTGRQRRANEDSFFARTPLFVVADGMGGAQAGEVASRVAVETLERGLPEGSGAPQELLAARIEEANEAIHELSRTDAQRAGMGTTITAVYVGEDEAAVAHVGDSRAYLLRGGELRRLTDDHSLVEELLRQGKLTPEEASDHPQKSIITRALGPEPAVEVDRQTVRLRADDVFLLCSDGLTSMIGEDLIEQVLTSTPSLTDAGHALVTAANDAGGRDNITVVLFRLEDIDTSAGAGTGEQATSTGFDAATPPEQRATAVAAPPRPVRAPTAAAPGPPPEPVRTAPRAPVPRAAGPPGERRRRRVPGWARALLALVVVLAVVVACGWVATRAVYFVGTDGQGRVALYRGLPYDLPAGISLYSRTYVSGVPAADLTAAQRGDLLDHQLRSHDDAFDLVRQLELGRLASSG